ncbi:LuxR C-terminal-related transcriptional regulator [Dictyobacter formicarum]|uniref:Helix-turn-helix transcriptional regulator n=1 Tax=Dictyobacter formicarum TaxID=2778368 RepID=A0ABQ3VL45_9CHLR|nr:LuxR C-terminal-related transcriptional regulator [Dictyobacter formicarum]GHO86548.1 helix-turn-helix transcriptional regulator [Dictyobacter formicarum]
MEISPTKQLLLATKLTMPQSYAPLVIPRIRLYHKLERGANHPLTLIAAPAGFGKTTLLAGWLQQHSSSQVAWLSLDKDDNDLIRFWCYCLAAFARVNPDLEVKVQECLDVYLHTSIEDMLAAFINILMTYPEPLICVLDDYQYIQLPVIHQSLTFFLEHLPSHVHLFISTRIDPLLPLVRLRVRGQLLEIRSSELRFTLDETVQLFSHGMKLQLEPEYLFDLLRATEGWIAGLQLAAMTLQRMPEQKERPATISSFMSINRHLARYLSEEILMTLPDDVLDFLFSTSILTRMRADLCNAVTGQGNAETMLEWLEQANLFIATPDEEGAWRSHHRLLAEFLRQQLCQKYPERLRELHIRASCWYEREHMLHEAVEHALAAHAYERAADLLEAHAWPLWMQGHIPCIFDWLAQLHESIELQQRPVVAYLSACSYLYTGQWERYEQALAIARHSWQASQNNEMLSSIYDLQACYAICTGNGKQALAYTQRALDANRNRPLLSSFSHVLRGAAHLCCGEIQQAQVELTSGQRIGSQMNCAIAIASGQLHQGRLRMMQGQLREAMKFYQQCSSNRGECMAWFARQAHVQAGQLYLEWNELVRAQEQLRMAQESSEQIEVGPPAIGYSMLAARLAWANGKVEQALLLLDQAEGSLTYRDNHTYALAQIALLRTQYRLAQGHVSAVQELLQRNYPTNLDERSLLEQELWQQAKARLLLAQQRPAEVIRLVQTLLPTIKAQGRIADELQFQMLLVQAYYIAGDIRRTRQTLEHILILAEPGGYRRLFLDEGQVLMTLLSELYHRQQKRYTGDLHSLVLSYVHALLLEFGCDVEPRDWRSWQKRAQRAQASLEQLSDRELEVLKLIAEGNSNQQIACTLVVAESTIKTHLNNIYSKLNVNSRLQALTKAHTVGLLEI